MSLALPSFDLGGQIVPGFVAAFYAGYGALLTFGSIAEGVSGRYVGFWAIDAAMRPYALLWAAYLSTLIVANLVVPLSFLGLRRLRIAAAILVSALPLVSATPQRLVVGEMATYLRVGYIVWLAAFWLLVAALYVQRRENKGRPVNS